MAALLTNIGSVITELISGMGEIVSGLTATDGALNGLIPFVALGLGISLFSLLLGKIRGLIWGM